MEDRELLQQYVEHQSEAAFTELVRRHLNLVFGTAQRVVRDRATASDVVQAVFIKLARKAWMVRDGNALAAWLYRATYHEACNAIRRETRRRDNEAEAMKFAEQDAPSAAAWEKLSPLVDEAMQRLSRVEQNAILLRYFEGKSLAETSMALGTTEAAARMRLNRAVEKIRHHFARGGVTIASAVLVAGLTTHACHAAPAGLAVTNVAQASLAGASAGGAAHAMGKFFATATKSKVAVTAIVVVAVAAIPLGLQLRQIQDLQQSLQAASTSAKSTNGKNAASVATPLSLAQCEAELKRILSLQGGMDLMHNLLDFASRLDAKTTLALLEEYAKLPPTDKNKLALSALVDRLVRLDPQAALAWANSIPATHGREQMLGILFDTWSNINPAAALAAAQAIDKPMLREELIGKVLTNWVRTDPAAVLAALQTLPGNHTTQDIYTAIFTTWGAADPAAATTAVMKLPANGNRNLAIEGLVEGWASVDPQAALAWADKLPASDTRTQAVAASLRVLAQQDPQDAASYAANGPNSKARTQLIQIVGSQWAQDDPVATMAWLQQLNLPGRGLDVAFASYLATPLTKVDPQAAAAYFSAMPRGGGERMASIAQIATTWAEQDPAGDLAWLMSIPNANRLAMLANVVNSWANNDPAAATAYVESTPHTDAAYPEMLTAIAKNLASVDLAPAMNWAQNLPEDGGSDIALSAVLDKSSAQDPAAAAQAILNLPDSAVRTSAVDHIMANWATQDPAAAAQWALGLPAGPLHDTAAMRFDYVMQQNDPATAFTVALTIGNQSARNTLLNRAVGYWAKTNPDAAANAVQSADVSDNLRSELLATLQKGAPAANAASQTPDN